MTNDDDNKLITDKFFYTEYFFCQICKSFESKLELFNDSHTNMHLFDYWSFLHIIFGIFLGILFKNIIIVLIINFAFEFWENSYVGVNLWQNIGVSFPDKLDYDTYINIIGDTICVLLGFYISSFGIETSLTAIALILIIIGLFAIIDENSSILIFVMRCLKNYKVI